ncbi:MAG: cobalamin-dependent protein [Chloroflexi bacterium]|nr:cobalamin-dependent protein [Chloroflexota bacterium]MBV9899011.1 cobalamin-dependent protein [Chloroflexota bacterium]
MTHGEDVLLIHPGSRQQVYQQLATDLAAIEPPLWAGMLAGHLQASGYSASIIDGDALELTPDDIAQQVAAIRPVLCCVVAYGHQPSASTQTMPAAGEICRSVKQLCPEQPVLLVGGHVSALPEQSLREEAADFVCQGEGPQTIRGLVDCLKSAAGSGLERIPGLWYRDPVAGVRSNAPALASRDIDHEYPRIPWEQLPMDRYRAHNWHCFDGIANRQPYASLYTTLGCPYRCTFCCINAPFRLGPDLPSSYRFHNPTQVVGELRLLADQYGVRNVKIADEMFVLNDRHVLGVCQGIVEAGLDLNIWAYARVDTVKQGLLEPLRRAGVTWLALGIESASKHVRDGVEKGRFGSEQIIEVVRSIQSAGINVIGNFIFGLPDDTVDTMQDTLDLALELKCEFANFYSAMAYPGSKLYEMAVDQHWELPETWSGFSQHAYDTLPLRTEAVSAGEVLGFRDHAFQVYFNDPGYLASVRTKFGDATASHIQEMAQKPLPRKYAIPPRILVSA